MLYVTIYTFPMKYLIGKKFDYTEMKVLEGRNINSWNSILRFLNNFYYFPLMIFFRAHM